MDAFTSAPMPMLLSPPSSLSSSMTMAATCGNNNATGSGGGGVVMTRPPAAVRALGLFARAIELLREQSDFEATRRPCQAVMNVIVEHYATIKSPDLRDKMHWLHFRTVRLTSEKILAVIQQITKIKFQSIDAIQGIGWDCDVLRLDSYYDSVQRMLQRRARSKKRGRNDVSSSNQHQSSALTKQQYMNLLVEEFQYLISNTTIQTFKLLMHNLVAPATYQPCSTIGFADTSIVKRNRPILPKQYLMRYKPIKLAKFKSIRGLDREHFIERLVPGQRVMIQVNDGVLTILSVSYDHITDHQAECPKLNGFAHYQLDGILSPDRSILTIYDVSYAEVDVALAQYRYRREFLESMLQRTERVHLSERCSSLEETGNVVIKFGEKHYRYVRDIYKIEQSVSFDLAAVAWQPDTRVVYVATQSSDGGSFNVVGQTHYAALESFPGAVHNVRPGWITFNGRTPNEKVVNFIGSPSQKLMFKVSCSDVTARKNLRLSRIEGPSEAERAVSNLDIPTTQI